MNDIPRIITGILLILGSLGIVLFLLFYQTNVFTLAGTALVILILGIYILQNKKENKIEEIKKK
jgi:glucose uptake protein GlcU